LQVNNQSVGVGKTTESGIILNKAIFLTQRIKLSYKENIVSFSFAALDYHAPDKNQYQYMLEGFDKNGLMQELPERLLIQDYHQVILLLR